MPVYAAKDFDGSTLSVVLARNNELAAAYWHGRGIIPHSVECREEEQLKDHPTGVISLVDTKLVIPRMTGPSRTKVRVIDCSWH